MTIQLSDHFNYKKLLRFTLPSIVMLVLTSVYGIVDGLFVTNFVGKSQFVAINLILPVLNILSTFGYMFGAGGSALVAKTLGEGDKEKANKIFSLLIYISAALGVLFTIVGFFTVRPISSLLGAKGQTVEYCVRYSRIILFAMPAWILQFEFQIFFATAEKPTLGLIITVIAGVANMVLDALFIVVFKWGIEGAAAATAISQIIGGILPVLYFCRKNKSLLKLGKTKFDIKVVLKSVTNGSSEFVSSISGSVVGILYNAQLLKYAGENGVAAYGVLMYVGMIFYAIFVGFSNGSAPVIGYHYGAKNRAELKNLLKKCVIVIAAMSVVMTALSEGLAYPLSWIFTRKDAELMNMTIRAFRLFSISFLMAGIGIFGSAFFTALNNGPISALISFCRTLLFQTGTVMLFPLFMGVDGIWVSIIAAEFLAAVVAIGLLIGLRNKYGYGRKNIMTVESVENQTA